MRIARTGRISIAVACLGALAAAGTLAAAAPKAVPPSVGKKAPDFSLKSLAGKTVRLSTLTKQGPVALVVLRGYPGYQ